MKNRALIVLALLGANDRWEQPEVFRTVLVKQAFLAETLRPLYRVWSQSYAFYRYHYGPYDDKIFEHLDVLICNGLVQVVSSARHRGREEARYSITDGGRKLLASFEHHELIRLSIDIVWSLQAIGVERATAICNLVYQEAEFARILAAHLAEGVQARSKVLLPLVTDSGNETFATLAVLQALARPFDGLGAMPPREIMRLFLKMLARQFAGRESAQGAAA